MKKLGGKLLVLTLHIWALFPMWYLYICSSILYVILYHVVGYRRKVVQTNLANAFPTKTQKDRKQIESEFYQYLCDLIVETIKIPRITKAQLANRCYVSDENFKKFTNLYDKSKSVILVLGHHGNYEWANLAFTAKGDYNFHAIYHPLSNSVLDQFFVETRGRLGTTLVPMKNAYGKIRETVTNQSNPGVFGLVADQSPSPKNAYWTTFLNQETGVFWGPERMAQKFDLPIIFVNVKRIKRGKYEIIPEILIENPSQYAAGEITELHLRKLEEKILKQPETWFWSHRRWKHSNPKQKTKTSV